MISDAELRSIVQATDAGEAAADALEVGDVFMGAGPAVDAADFVTFSPAWRLFVDSYLACLPATRHHRSRGSGSHSWIARKGARHEHGRKRARPACGRH